MQGGRKVPTMYEVKGKVLGFGAVIAVVIFIIILSGYNKVEPDVKTPLSWSIVDKNGGSYKFAGEIVQGNSSIKDIYAVVFDAGSTGSRVHILHFKSKGIGSSLVLVKEKFDYVKPGLSSYGHDPVQAAESLRKLMNLALSEVPSHLQHETPITLKATAGLRLLPEKNATEILKRVKMLFREYNSFLVADDAVTIMDGVDEGVFSWMTVNFLLGRLKTGAETVAALDLGGGSTQITFTPMEQATISGSPSEFIKTVNLFKQRHILYTHSYLGLGLKAARYHILGGLKDKRKNSALSSICLPLGFNGTWKYDGVPLSISGDTTQKSNFLQCLVKAQELVEPKVLKVDELQKKELYIFSYFYDRAEDAQLIAKDDIMCVRESFPLFILRFSHCLYWDQDQENTGKLTVADFEKAARKFFENPASDKPFLAMDLAYIYALLHHGYRLSPSDSVVLKKKINDVEVSWAVGAAFQLLSSVGKAR